ncbi:MAG TPA: hypothetical protein V6C69_01200 [Trichormus sp.]|jgi:hypothetical protein
MAGKQLTNETTEERVLWMADCYSLAKVVPNPHTWLYLLESDEQQETADNAKLADNPQYAKFRWLWMEIWKAAQAESEAEEAVAVT